MAKVITVSKVFPKGHINEGFPTNFIDKILQKEKVHTIRAGSRWKSSDMYSLRVWSDKPYRSPQTIMQEDKPVCRVAEISIHEYFSGVDIDGRVYFGKDLNAVLQELADNDGLTLDQFKGWFEKSLPFYGQIIFFHEKETSY